MNDFDITQLEQTIGDAIKQTGAAQVVYHDRPKSTQTKHDSFIVCAVLDEVEDFAAYGMCTLEVSLFARDVAGLKNDTMLGIMYRRVISNLPASVGKYVIDRHPKVIADLSDDYGFHARVIEFQIIIKVV